MTVGSQAMKKMAPAANIDRCTAERCGGGCEAPDVRFYATVIDGPKVGFLLGPFDTHQEALDHVPAGRAAAERVDFKAAFYGFGTMRVAGPPWPSGVLSGRGHGCGEGR